MPLPSAVAAGSKLTGSESFANAGVSDRCNNLSGQKGAGAASESVSWVKIPDANACLHSSGSSIFPGDNVSKELCTAGKDCFVLSTSRPEVKELQLKAGKVSRSGSGFAKRLRATQMEDSPSEAGDNRLSKLGLSITERTQVVKQRNNLNGKRGEKRNSKVMRSKYDSFSLKTPSLNFNTSTGGSNIFGVFGLKSDFVDVTKHEDELLLDVLLDGSYKHTTLSKDTGRKAANVNGSLLESVRKACSILQLRRPVSPQGFPEDDNWLSKKVSSFPLNSGPSTTTRLEGDKGDAYAAPFGKIEDSCRKPEVPDNTIAASSYEPKDVLERLALPPPKDLESLLIDTAKHTVSLRTTTDTRSGKQISRQISLPIFPWSHASGGHFKVNSDAAKSSTSRSTCQVRWVRIGNPSPSVSGVAPCSVDLESLTFDHNLVPSVGSKSGFSGDRSMQTEHGPSYATCSRAPQVSPGNAEVGDCVKSQNDDVYVHSPRGRVAAQILYDIVVHPPRLNPQGAIGWMKKPPSQGTIKACQPKSKERPEEIFTRLDTAAGVLLQSDDDTTHFKRLKHSTEKKKDHGLSKPFIKAPMSWSTPRSSRSSPIKPLKDTLAQMRHFTATPRHSSREIPSVRALEKSCNSQQKLRRLLPMDWNRAKGKLE